MALKQWSGAAQEVTEVLRVSVAQLIVPATYSLTVGIAQASYTAAEDDTRATIAAGLAEALNAAADGFTAAIDPDDDESILIESDDPGVPLSPPILNTSPPYAAVIELQAGRPDQPQIHQLTLPENSGGNITLSVSVAGGAVQTTGNISSTAAASAHVSALEALSNVGVGDVTVELLSTAPNSYRYTWTGALAGQEVTLTCNTAALTGAAVSSVEVIQEVGALSRSVQSKYFAFAADQTAQFSFDGGVTESAAFELATMTAADLASALSTLAGADVDVVLGPLEEIGGAYGRLILIAAAADVGLLAHAGGMTGGLWSTYGATVLQVYGATTHHFVAIDVSAGYSGTLTINGQTTGSITSKADLETELEALSSVGPVTIHELTNDTDVFLLVEFAENVSHGALTHSGSWDIDLLAQGSGANEIVAITVDADSGDLVFDHDSESTAPMTWPPSAADVKTEMEALTGVDVVNVTRTGSGPYTWFIEFAGSEANTDVPAITVDDSALVGGPDATIVSLQSAEPGQNAKFRLELDETRSGGTFVLRHEGYTTTQIAHNANAAAIDSPLEALDSIPASAITVTGAGNSFEIEFGGDLAKTVQLLEVDGSELTVDNSARLAISFDARATGPLFWNDPDNWYPEGVPGYGDAPELADVSAQIRHGLTMVAEFTRSGGQLLTDGDFALGQAVRVETDDTLPTGLAANTTYYVRSVARTIEGNYIALATTPTGTPIALSNAGTGPHRIHAALESLTIRQSFTGAIGWPRRRADGRFETHARALKTRLQTAAAGSANLTVGGGDGNGSREMYLDLDNSPLAGRVINTGQGRSPASPALQLLVDSAASAELDVTEGEVGIALQPDDESALELIRATGGRCVLGNVDVAQVQDYAQAIEFTTAVAGSSVTRFRR